ncbi:putative inactive linolenate hydroperoxide lyase [Nymphaea thermarum]|nr:putative inactive linolenate hydroperoxide lyase [Nymphaea thermarum]
MVSTEFTGSCPTWTLLRTSTPGSSPMSSTSSCSMLAGGCRRSVEETWGKLQGQLPEAKANDAFGSCVFNFLSRTLLGRYPLEPGRASVGEEGASLCLKWLAPQLAPGVNIGLPHPLEELVFHTFPWPYWTVKKNHQKLYDFFKTYGGKALDIAEDEYGVPKEEAIHNLIFMFGLNAVAGFSLYLPTMLRYVANQGSKLHYRLAEEARNAIKEKGDLNFEALNAMPLIKSVAYGPKLLERVWWSNGPETEAATPHNKQCPGKDIVVLTARMVNSLLQDMVDLNYGLTLIHFQIWSSLIELAYCFIGDATQIEPKLLVGIGPGRPGSARRA